MGALAGGLVRVLATPGTEVTSLQWDEAGKRLAVNAGSGVYVAETQVRPIWCHFSDTVAYAEELDMSSTMLGHGRLPTEPTPCVTMLSMLSGEKRTQRVPGLLMLAVRRFAALATIRRVNLSEPV